MGTVQEIAGLVFTQSSKVLGDALGHVGDAVSSAATIPVLKNVLVSVNGDDVTIVGTDLGIWISHTSKAKVGTTGRAVVDYAKLSGFVGGFEDSQVELSVLDTKITAKSGRSRLSMNSMPADSFPTKPVLSGLTEFTIQSQELLRVIRAAKRSMVNEKYRPILNGILWKTGQDLVELVATDGVRLSRARTKTSSQEGLSAVIPRQAVEVVENNLNKAGDVQVTVLLKPDAAVFKFGGLEVMSKVIAGQYPDYQRVIPSSGSTVVVVDCQQLLSSVRRTSLCAESINRVVKFSVVPGDENRIVLESSNQAAEVFDEVPCISISGDVIVGLDHRLLRDALESLGEGKIKISLNGAMGPVLLEPEQAWGNTQVVMPVRLSNV